MGPTELYKLTKEIGKTIQNFRSLSTEASKSFESTMENQLELEELRKAQRELNDAFSFRRSINTDEDNDFNEVSTESSESKMNTMATAAVAETKGGETATDPKKRKVKRRRVKKKLSVDSADGGVGGQGQVPDLDMSAAFDDSTPPAVTANGSGSGYDKEEESSLREQRMARLTAAAESESKPDWFDSRDLDELTRNKETEEGKYLFGDTWAESRAEEQERFVSQLSEQWNESILANENELAPLAKIMDRLAILEEERKAATMRLEEEFRMRGELEEEFYRKKKELLEQSAAEVQAEAYKKVADKAGGKNETLENEKQQQ